MKVDQKDSLVIMSAFPNTWTYPRFSAFLHDFWVQRFDGVAFIRIRTSAPRRIPIARANRAIAQAVAAVVRHVLLSQIRTWTDALAADSFRFQHSGLVALFGTVNVWRGSFAVLQATVAALIQAIHERLTWVHLGADTFAAAVPKELVLDAVFI